MHEDDFILQVLFLFHYISVIEKLTEHTVIYTFATSNPLLYRY